jgi:hypothetical protein
MKILITEEQFKLILSENTEGIDVFLEKVIQRYPEVSEFVDALKHDIEKCGVKKISLESTLKSSGVSHPDFIYISNQVLNYNLSSFIFVLFHEILHQYQYKKYGVKYVLSTYVDDMNEDETIKRLFEIEKVADRFGKAMVSKYYRLGYLSSRYVLPSPYNEYSIPFLKQELKQIKKELVGITDPMEAANKILQIFLTPNVT